MRYKLCLSMYGGGRAMWYPGRGSFLLGSAVVGVGGRGEGGLNNIYSAYFTLIDRPLPLTVRI